MSEGLGGNQTTLSLTSGYSSSRFNVMGIIHHRSNEAIYARGRSHSQKAFSPIGSPGAFRILKSDGKTPYSQGKSLAPHSQWQPAPQCPSDRILVVQGGKTCQYNYAKHMTTRPELRQTSGMLRANFQVKENTHGFIRLSGTHRKTYQVFPPSPATSHLGLGVHGKQVKTYLAKGGSELKEAFYKLQDDDFVDIQYRLLELGERRVEVKTDQYSVFTGLTVTLDNSWDVRASVGYNQSSMVDIGVNGFALSDDLRNRLANNFNPFAPVGQRGILSDLNRLTKKTSLSHLSMAEVSTHGEILNLSSGPLGIALGTQAHKEILRTDADEDIKRGQIIGNSGRQLFGKRDVLSHFIELSTPLTSNLEWGVSGRHDSYSDFGESFSPKTSLRWQASPQVIIRSSIGQGFKAPNMDDLYKAPSQSYEKFVDKSLCHKNGGVNCLSGYRKVVSRGNKSLKKEESSSVNLGVVVQPHQNFSFSLDGWYLKLNNQVGIDYGDVTLAEERFGAKYVKSFDILIDRDLATGVINEIRAPSQNLAETETSGLDLFTEMSTQTWFGQLIFGVQHSHLFYMKSVGFPGLEKQDKLGQSGHPPWRNRVSVAVAPTNNQSGSMTARTVARPQKTFLSEGVPERIYRD